jgi:amino acid adenylation domain-containing protein
MMPGIEKWIWEWAAKTPNAVAVTDRGRHITYRELARKAAALSKRLRAAGAEIEVPVAVSLEPSAELITALVAIFYTGAGYAPIDPGYPAERRNFLIEDARCPVVITDAAHAALYAGFGGSLIVYDDQDADRVAAHSSNANAGKDDRLAYVIYTSGSTGQPKGVEVTQGNLTRLFESTDQWFGFDPGDVWTLFHSASFDFSVWEIWGALRYGGRLVVVPSEIRRDPQAFRELVREEGVTVLNQTPSAFRLFDRADALPGAAGADVLRYVILGGEALDPRTLEPWFERHSDAAPRVVNMYGITETTVHVTYRPLSRADVKRARSPIGVPIPDLTLHILDRDGKPAAAGQEGELYVGGAGVARGYLRRPELTAERFRPDPFSPDPNARLYRTGDLACAAADGEIEYCGRLDDQVKLRGFRIELGEIEAALRRAPGVEDAAAAVRRDQGNEGFLAGYVVLRPGARIADVEQAIRASLPEYMQPSALIALDALPLTAHGKLDRSQLNQLKPPAPAPKGSDKSRVDGGIAELFAEIIGAAPENEDTDFFAMGGTSLQAMMLSLRIAERYGKALPPGAVFRYPTVRGLTEEVERACGVPGSCVHEKTTSLWRPLSTQQEQIWLAQMLAPDSPALHCVAAFRIRGRVDVQRLRDALDRACRRHPALRATFEMRNGRPEQRFADAPVFELTVEEAEAEAFARRPMDLSRAAGAAALLGNANGQCIFALVLHHLISDGWSLANLLAEIAADYDGKTVPEPRVSFVDLALTQHRRLERGELADAESYWTRELADAPSTSTIPPENEPRAAGDSPAGLVPFEISESLSARLGVVAGDSETTVNTAMLAALAILLHRYNGQTDQVIGVPYAGRDAAGSADVQGLFMNLLPLRIRLNECGSVRRLLGRMHRRNRESFAHSELPFTRIVQAAGASRIPGRQPLAQVLFAPQTEGLGQFRIAGAEASPLRVDTGRTIYDLVVSVWPAGGGFEAEIFYNARSFSRSAIEEFRNQFLRTLESIADSPERNVFELEIFPVEQRRRLLREWSGREEADRRAHVEPAHFLDIFAKVVEAGPEREAIAYGAESMTYGELDRWSNRIAYALAGRGAGRDTLVAICCERSPAAIAAVLGVWKAGAAYAPLDPIYPPERLSWMMSDCKAPFLITSPRCNGIIPNAPETLVVDGSIDAWPSGSIPATRDPGALAYVIYTSGSTGVPKGVMIEQRGVAALCAAILEIGRLPEGARILQYTSLSFDVCVGDILSAFVQGAAMVIPAQMHMLAGSELLDVLQKERITQTLMPMSVLEQLDARPLPHLRRLVSGGERCPAALVERWAAGRAFVNSYGPTETSVGATAHICRLGEGAPPIGIPFPGWTVYVLDGHGQPVPPLASGELYIGGNGLARGYLGRPELTAERFCDGMPAIPERLYRTGDIVRWRRDGLLEFVGRTDRQAKVRGFRVELGEIEAALLRDTRVRAAAAIVDGEGASARVLAYVVPASAEFHAETELLSRLRSALPSQSVPSAIFQMDELPLTQNGKLDESALPRPEPMRSESRVGKGPAAEIWREILDKDANRGVNFFDAGGTSLDLVRMQTAIETRLGMRVSLSELFAHATIEGLDALLASRREVIPAPEAAVPETRRRAGEDSIAIVGMSARFPGAADIETFWRNLCKGVESIRHFSGEALAAAGVSKEHLADPRYVRARATIDDTDAFDAALFGISAAEAEAMDPQQRVWLECALAALEDAGCNPRRFAGDIGVFAGVGAPEYLIRRMEQSSIREEDYTFGLGNEKDFAATRTSYKLGLRGPSLTVQTACSTSLVAVCVACRSMLDGDCDVAVAGAASLSIPSDRGYFHREGMILSPDGHCRPFDRMAQGTVPGDGVGAVVLKRLADAQRDGDDIYAVIAGSAINNDGSEKAAFTAPGQAGQETVIRRALEKSGISARDVTYVEAHGTATALGDPIEFAALRNVFESGGAAAGQCSLGSVKANIGHLNAAAGIAGLIKAALAIERGIIPGTLRFNAPNAAIDLEPSPFRIHAETRPWQCEGLRAAGVSSFGVGGTNAHVVLVEAPKRPARASGGLEILPVSAASPAAGETLARNLAAHLERSPSPIAPVARTLQAGRIERRFRLFAVAGDSAEAAGRLREASRPREVLADPCPAFLFPGDGSFTASMAVNLSKAEPLVAAELERVDEVLKAATGEGLLTMLRSASPASETAQPARFAMELALARAWIAIGIAPQAMLGYGLGEYTAACLAGVFTVQDAIRLIVERGRLMQSISPEAWELLDHELDPIFGPFRRAAKEVKMARPQIPFVSSATGEWINDGQTIDASYWVRQVRRPVRFDAALDVLLGRANILIEAGPGCTMAAGARQHPARPEDSQVIATFDNASDGAGASENWLSAIGQAWCAGVEIDWSALRERHAVGMAHLPAYPFERKRYWAIREPAPAQRNPSDAIYVPQWSKGPTEHAAPAVGPLLILGSPEAIPEQTYRRLCADPEARPIVARAGARFRRTGEGTYEIHPASREDIAALLAAIKGPRPASIVHTFAEGPIDDLKCVDHALERGYFSVMATIQALAVSDLSAPLTVITQESGAEGNRINPAGAMVRALFETARAEYPELSLQHIDLTDQEPGVAQSLTVSLEPAVIARGVNRLHDGGVYLITGGTGGIGLTLAEHLAAKYKARLALASRNPLPPEQEWPKVEDPEMRRRIRLFEQVRETAGEVVWLQGDVGNPADARSIVRSVLDRYGELHGVIHAAGVAGGGAIARRQRRPSDEILRAKVWGTIAIDAAIEEIPDCFLFLCSSLTALGGGYGQADYAAANAFADAFAARRNSARRRVVSVNWDGWADVGMLARHTPAEREGVRRQDLLAGEEGARIFEMCLAASGANYAVSKAPPERRQPADGRPMASRTAADTRHARPNLSTAFLEPAPGLETDIAEVWRQALGLAEVGAHDDFFELGGDSLLAVQMSDILHSSLAAEVPAHLLLENPTVAALASRLSEKGPGRSRLALVRLAEGPPGSGNLFLAHPIGGNVYFYLPLARELSRSLTVYGFQAQGADGQTAPRATVEEMAAAYVAEMREKQAEGPYRIGGSSFGGVVAFEMARQLRAAKESVDFVAMIDCPAPWSVRMRLQSDAQILAYHLAQGGDPLPHLEKLEGMEDDDLFRAFLALSGPSARLAPEADTRTVRGFLHLFRRNFEALALYRPEPCDVKCLFFAAAEQQYFYDTRHYAGEWKQYVAQMEAIRVPGNHTSMNLAPNCEQIARRIRAGMDVFEESEIMNVDRVAIVQKALGEYLKGNLEPLFQAAHAEIEVRLTIGPDTPLSGTFRGKEGLREYLRRNDEHVEVLAFEVLNILEGGDQIAIFGRESIRIKQTGDRVQDSDWVMLCTFRDEKIGAITVVEDTSAVARALSRAAAESQGNPVDATALPCAPSR